MKARKRNSNDEWQEVEYVQLRDSSVITKADQIEFSTEEKYWQDVREKAAIAALQGMLANSGLRGNSKDYISVSVEYADALVKQLKTK